MWCSPGHSVRQLRGRAAAPSSRLIPTPHHDGMVVRIAGMVREAVLGEAKGLGIERDPTQEDMRELEVCLRQHPLRQPMQRLWEDMVGSPMGEAGIRGQPKEKTGWRHQRAPDQAGPAPDDLKDFLDQFLKAEGNLEGLSGLRAKAEELRGGLLGHETKTSRTAKLRSAIDKLEHKRSLAKSLKAKLTSVVAQVEQLEEQVDNHNVEVSVMERSKLCDSVAGDPESDTEAAWGGNNIPKTEQKKPTPHGTPTKSRNNPQGPSRNPEQGPQGTTRTTTTTRSRR